MIELYHDQSNNQDRIIVFYENLQYAQIKTLVIGQYVYNRAVYKNKTIIINQYEEVIFYKMIIRVVKSRQSIGRRQAICGLKASQSLTTSKMRLWKPIG